MKCKKCGETYTGRGPLCEACLSRMKRPREATEEELMALDEYATKREQEHHRGWVAIELSRLQARGFFGTMTLHLENGLVKRMKVEESKIPPPFPPVREAAAKS